MSNGTDICSRLIIVFINYYTAAVDYKNRWRQSQLIVLLWKNAIPFSSEAAVDARNFARQHIFFSGAEPICQNELLISATKLHFLRQVVIVQITHYQNNNTSSWCVRGRRERKHQPRKINSRVRSAGSTFISQICVAQAQHINIWTAEKSSNCDGAVENHINFHRSLGI